MKHLLLVLLLFILSVSSQAQQNLVPNPSFEDTVYCPWGTNQLDACADWLNFGNSPDYFNTCTGFGGPPFNYGFGDQNTHSGNAMAGIVTYYKPNSSVPDNYREFIGVQLNNPLIIGQKYFYSFNINFSAQFQNSIASNKAGLNFTTNPFSEFSPPPLVNNAVLYTDSILKDSLNWLTISGSFIADSAYQFLVIGNFFDDNHTDTIGVGTYPLQSYYYIDDICVSTDSIYNSTWTGIPQSEFNSNFKIYPNPSNDIVNIQSGESFNEIELVNSIGQTLLHERFQLNNNYNFSLPASISSGIYLLKVKHKNSVSVHKLIVQF